MLWESWKKIERQTSRNRNTLDPRMAKNTIEFSVAWYRYRIGITESNVSKMELSVRVSADQSKSKSKGVIFMRMSQNNCSHICLNMCHQPLQSSINRCSSEREDSRGNNACNIIPRASLLNKRPLHLILPSLRESETVVWVCQLFRRSWDSVGTIQI